MAKPGRSSEKPPTPKKPAKVIDNRPFEKRFPLSSVPGDLNVPIRTVLFVEVGEMPADQVRQVIAAVNKNYIDAAHPHYVACIRNGKITNEPVFENEFLNIVKKICEVKDGKVAMKGGAHEVRVIRERL